MNTDRRILTKVVLFVQVSLVIKTCCGNDCALDGVSTGNWEFGLYLDPILDTQPAGTVLLNKTAQNIRSIDYDAATTGEYAYMWPTLVDDRLILTLTDRFVNYEEEQTTAQMKITVYFACTTDTARMEIYQTITDTNNHDPEFSKSEYTFTLPMPFPKNFALHALEAICARDVDLTNDRISFRLEGGDTSTKGFSASWLARDANDVKLHYASLLTTSLLNLRQNVTFNLYATDAGEPPRTSEARVNIIIDEENSVSLAPKFEHPIYIANLSNAPVDKISLAPIEFNPKDIALVQGAGRSVTYSLVDNIADYASNFEVAISSDYTTCHLTLTDPSEKILSENFVTLTLIAFEPSAVDTGQTVLLISLPGSTRGIETTQDADTTIEMQPTSTATVSATADSTETSTETGCPACPTECPTTVERPTTSDCPTTIEYVTTSECPTIIDCPTTTECPAPIECPTTTDDPTTVECVTHECNCETSTPWYDSDPSRSTGGKGASEATDEGPIGTDSTISTDGTGSADDTTNTDDTTDTDDTVNPDSTPSTDSTTNPDDTTSPDSTVSTDDPTSTETTPSLSFSKSLYRFDIETTFTGILMKEPAVATNVDGGTIVYDIIIDDQNLEESIDVDPTSAELRVTTTIEPGVYTFQIVATLDDWFLSATSIVVLNVVDPTVECPGDSRSFEYALRIVELQEELSYFDVVPLDDNGCNYTIYSQSPDEDWFFVDGTLYSNAIDRESPRFENMTVAQVRVVLDMSCDPENASTSRSSVSTLRDKRDTEHPIISGDIRYERRRLIVIAIITDINDNPPVWSPNTPGTIGFPERELTALIQLSAFHKFFATDADIGENAVIEYSVDQGSDSYYIHPTEGTLYIRHDGFAEDGSVVTLVASDSLTKVPTRVTIRTVEKRHVAVFYVTGAVLEDVDVLLEELSEATGYRIQSLGAAVLSVNSDLASLAVNKRAIERSTDFGTLLRMLVYALKDGSLVNYESLADSVEKAKVQWKFSRIDNLDSLLPTPANEVTGETSSTTGFWATIGVLIFLVILLGTSFAVYLCTGGKRSKLQVGDVVPYARMGDDNRSDSRGNTSTPPAHTGGRSVVFVDKVEEIREDVP